MEGLEKREIRYHKFTYNGKETDAWSNLSDYGSRLYDPAKARWDVSDPAAMLLEKSSTYAYALNNPMNFIDPSGELPIFINGRVVLDSERESSSYWSKQLINTIMQSGVGNPNAAPYYVDGDQYYHETNNIVGTQLSTPFGGSLPWLGLQTTGQISKGGWFSGHSPSARQMAGMVEALGDFDEILSKLERTDGKITEKIQIYTHSRGAAFGEGYTTQLLKLIGQNADQFADPNNVIEFVLNLAPHQSHAVSATKVPSFSITHLTDPLSSRWMKNTNTRQSIANWGSDYWFHGLGLGVHSNGSFINEVRSFLGMQRSKNKTKKSKNNTDNSSSPCNTRGCDD